MERDGHRLARFANRLTIVRAVVAIAVVAIALTLGAAALAHVVEPETFSNVGDACWWALQTVTTVGYGDTVPVTVGGRIIAAAVMLLGVALVPAVTSIVIAVLITRIRERSGLQAEHEMEVVERLERLERRLDARRDLGDG